MKDESCIVLPDYREKRSIKISDLQQMPIVKGPFTLKWGDSELKESKPQTKLVWQGQEVLVEEFRIDHSLHGPSVINIKGRLLDDADEIRMNRVCPDLVIHDIDMKIEPDAVDKLINDISGVKSTMGYKDETCATACDGGYGASLDKLAVQLDKGENEQLLSKYGVVRDDGTLTQTGQDLLLAVVFKDEEVKGRLIETLKAIDATTTKV